MMIRIMSGKKFLLSTILFFQVTAVMEGQIAGGLTETTNARLGGNNYVVGMVFFPSGTPVNIRIAIRLSTPENGDIFASTDDSGKFVFSGVSSGVYAVVIDSEPDYEPVRHEVEITRSRSAVPETYSVSIRLRDRVKIKSKAEKPAVISAGNAGVPKPALAFYEKAAGLARVGNHQAAVEQLKLAVTEYPKFLNAFNEMGVQYLRLNEAEKADEALRSALRIKPDAFEPLLNCGIALIRLKRNAEAEQMFRESLKVKVSAVGHYYLGRALIKLGRNEESEKALKYAIELGGEEFKEAHRLLAVIYLNRGDRSRVVEELETYLRLVPAAPDADELRQVIQQNKTATVPTLVAKPNR